MKKSICFLFVSFPIFCFSMDDVITPCDVSNAMIGILEKTLCGPQP